MGGPITCLGLLIQDGIHLPRGAPWTRHHPPIVSIHAREVMSPELSGLCNGVAVQERREEEIPLLPQEGLPQSTPLRREAFPQVRASFVQWALDWV